MAFWDKITSRGDVEDRRGMPVAGKLGLGGLALITVFTLLSGGNAGDVLVNILRNAPQGIQTQQQDTSQYAGQDTYEVFVSTVLGSANDMWKAKFSEQGKEYHEPKLVLFRQYTDSACGGASSDVGPHYCPYDETVYLDETFFDELTNRFGARGGDVAQAYVIAHEVGHHAQNLLGTLATSGSNQDSIKTELQADCYAGLWANSVKDKGVLESGEINEALDAAAAVGDDRIQSKIQGRINPETWTHGSSSDRVKWFTAGYDKGTLDACRT
jgi:predicted metalloprotease